MCSKQNRRFKSKHFNTVTGINESKILTKHVSWKCECKFDSRKCNSSQNWYKDKSQYECKNPKKHFVCKKDYFWNPARFSCEKGNMQEV